jgi:hypothetical protein
MRGSVWAAIGLGGCMAVAAPVAADLRTDARRESILELRFTENLNLTGRALDAEVSGDTAILRGTVKSEEDRTEAEQLVLDSGFRQVDNKLTVEPPPDDQPDKNPALTSEEREQREAGRRAAARAREREQQAQQAQQPQQATPEPAAVVPQVPAPARPVSPTSGPFETAPLE